MRAITCEEVGNSHLYDKENVNSELKGSLEVLKTAYGIYGDDMVYACSFGAEGSVLIDLISRVHPGAKVVFLDTQFHFDETYELIKTVKKRYPELSIDMVKPDLTPEQQAEQYGEALWKRQPDRCCHMRKIIPLQRVLEGYKAWISGLRRDQSPARQTTQFVNDDAKFGLKKICPLIYWTWDDVWAYIEEHHVPYNPLHDQGYPSIGCEQCTLPAVDPNDLRSGRWASTEKTECGLHT